MRICKPLLATVAVIGALFLGSRATAADYAVGQLDMGRQEAMPALDAPIEGGVEPSALYPDNPWGPPPPGAPACEAASGCCSICGQGSCCPPCWYLEEGVRVLTRTRAGHQRLAERAGTIAPRTALTTKSDSFDIAPGYFTTFGRYLGHDAADNDRYIEFSFWGLNQWDLDACANSAERVDYRRPSDDALVFRGGELRTAFPLDIVGFNGADSIVVNYDHEINNVELNYWIRPRARADRLVLEPNGRWVRQCQTGCFISYVIGLRMLAIDDGFALRSQGQIDIPGGGNNVAVAGDYRIDTDNTLLGFQLGTDFEFRQCRWSWGGRFRAAPFVNFADQESRIFADRLNAAGNGLGTAVALSRKDGEEGAAAVIELGLMANYRLAPHCLVGLGYDVMWVPGVALAPDQLDYNLNGCTQLNNGATLFYHGLTMSMKWAW